MGQPGSPARFHPASGLRQSKRQETDLLSFGFCRTGLLTRTYSRLGRVAQRRSSLDCSGTGFPGRMSSRRPDNRIKAPKDDRRDQRVAAVNARRRSVLDGGGDGRNGRQSRSYRLRDMAITARRTCFLLSSLVTYLVMDAATMMPAVDVSSIITERIAMHSIPRSRGRDHEQ